MSLENSFLARNTSHGSVSPFLKPFENVTLYSIGTSAQAIKPFFPYSYSVTRNRVISELRKAKHAFFEHLQTADDKTFWKLYKTLTGGNPQSQHFKCPITVLCAMTWKKLTFLTNNFSAILITQPHQIVTQAPSTTLTTLTTSIHLTFQRNFYVRRTRCYP